VRIKDKLEEIEQYLEELMVFVPSSFEDYKHNSMVKAACERYFEKIAEATMDLSFLLLLEKEWPSPENEENVFVILLNRGIISESLSKKLKEIKSMRNFLAHKYGKVNDELVFHALAEELEKDVKEFLRAVRLNCV